MCGRSFVVHNTASLLEGKICCSCTLDGTTVPFRLTVVVVVVVAEAKLWLEYFLPLYLVLLPP